LFQSSRKGMPGVTSLLESLSTVLA
jgi:hypothetical protein